MDCPSEEQMIRMKSEGLTNIESLRFDLPKMALMTFGSSMKAKIRMIPRHFEQVRGSTS
jgi:hypothetical protein